MSSPSLTAQKPLYIDDLEMILEESLLSLNTMAEDGSIISSLDWFKVVDK
ncbi:hypothetical protein SLEP1_g36618 [Rubroshorea leprosula]|uniref:Uncharacterized protein n=1 Tax=Rubroshorea leprosula TaxID=152421 RepID=A0AAV5KSK2_9ROSI|nr:hypothetical protein SLEP1_g36618 [Rubroshorea leprosula]